MHDCREVERKLIDLVFDELGMSESERFMSEIDECSECLAEFDSLQGTMRMFDRATEATLPDESYWPQHHAALRQRLEADASTRIHIGRDPLWKRLLTVRLRVPVPVAAAVVLALLALSLLALRLPTAPQTQIVLAQPAPQQTASPAAVPVVNERVITRTVYVERKALTKGLAPRRSGGSQRSEPQLTAREANEGSRNGSYTRVSLADYQPPDEMRIRIIKRSKSDEK